MRDRLSVLALLILVSILSVACQSWAQCDDGFGVYFSWDPDIIKTEMDACPDTVSVYVHLDYHSGYSEALFSGMGYTIRAGCDVDYLDTVVLDDRVDLYREVEDGNELRVGVHAKDCTTTFEDLRNAVVVHRYITHGSSGNCGFFNEMWFGTCSGVCMFIECGSVPYSMCYQATGNSIYYHCPVAGDQATWGQIKAIY